MDRYNGPGPAALGRGDRRTAAYVGGEHAQDSQNIVDFQQYSTRVRASGATAMRDQRRMAIRRLEDAAQGQDAQTARGLLRLAAKLRGSTGIGRAAQ